MASTQNNAKVSETENAEGEVIEKRVETVDHQSPAGQGLAERRRDVEVIHQVHPSGAESAADGAMAGAAASVAGAIQSAKDAVSGTRNERDR